MDTSANDPFLKNLERIANDRGKRAALRRFWSQTTRHQSYPVLGELGALRDDRKAVLAALYAEHPQHQSGQTVGKAALRLEKPEGGEHPYDRHFRRLLACDGLDDLAQQLHRLVKRLEREGIGLDYESLLIHLYMWTKSNEPQKREDVKVRWAADFWQAPIVA